MLTRALFPNTTRRTRPEQILGLAIWILISFCAAFLTKAPLALSSLIYFTLQPAAIWTLWRVHSLKTLKLETALFLSQFLFLAICGFSSFVSLAAVLFLVCNTLICFLLFRKKERLAGYLLVFPFFYSFYLSFLHMRYL